MIVAKIIGSKRVAALTGITNAITEFLLVKYGFMEDPNWIGITGASSASLIALLYWIFLEPEHKTVVKLAMDSYTGSFRPKKKE
uniref:Uncharacterized protein n=1 Tax=Acrobeloides nanus TaxID=290746 RepID=A0A914BV00_9BILA